MGRYGISHGFLQEVTGHDLLHCHGISHRFFVLVEPPIPIDMIGCWRFSQLEIFRKTTNHQRTLGICTPYSVHLGTSWYILVHLTFQQVTLQKTRRWTMTDPKFCWGAPVSELSGFEGGKNGHIEWNTQTHTHTLCGSNIEIYVHVVVDTQMLVKSWFWINGSHSVFAHVG